MLGRRDLRRGHALPAAKTRGSGWRDLREAVPNLLIQMLLRGANGVGYTNYPDNVVQALRRRRPPQRGIDLFRVFDCLNWVENMRVAMDAVRRGGQALRRRRSATPATSSIRRAPSMTSNYYVGLAKELEKAGAHILGDQGHGGPAEARRSRAC